MGWQYRPFSQTRTTSQKSEETASGVTEAEQRIAATLKKALDPQHLKVMDVSGMQNLPALAIDSAPGGCGAMYKIEVFSSRFHGLFLHFNNNSANYSFCCHYRERSCGTTQNGKRIACN
jgi:stress-induced morphogen